MKRFKDILISREHFVLSFELVPARGSKGANIDEILKFADETGRSSLLDALSLTDNPGGEPALAPEVLGREIKEMGINPIIHFSAKDGNRNSIESRGLALDIIKSAPYLATTVSTISTN